MKEKRERGRSAQKIIFCLCLLLWRRMASCKTATGTDAQSLASRTLTCFAKKKKHGCELETTTTKQKATHTYNHAVGRCSIPSTHTHTQVQKKRHFPLGLYKVRSMKLCGKTSQTRKEGKKKKKISGLFICSFWVVGHRNLPRSPRLLCAPTLRQKAVVFPQHAHLLAALHRICLAAQRAALRVEERHRVPRQHRRA